VIVRIDTIFSLTTSYRKILVYIKIGTQREGDSTMLESEKIVVLAVNYDNEFTDTEIAAIKRLQEAGYQIHITDYYPKVPAQMTELRSLNQLVNSWHRESSVKRNEIAEKLAIPENCQHKGSEILGPDEVFGLARKLKAAAILTHDPKKLKQSLLSKAFDNVESLFSRKHYTIAEARPAAFVAYNLPKPVLKERIVGAQWKEKVWTSVSQIDLQRKQKADLAEKKPLKRKRSH
jgi:hypothetical protein